MATTEVLSPQRADSPLFDHLSTPIRTSPTSSIHLVGSSPPSSSPKESSQISTAERRDSFSTSSSSSRDVSPPPSTMDFSNTSSFSSTPISSGVSLEDKLRNEEEFDFPNYDTVPFSHRDDASVSSQRQDGYDSDAPEISTTTDTTQDDSPLPTPTVVDDTAIKQEPSRHVDYLSHDWREEDIWSSWRHIVSQRKVYGQKSRLENASWRTWAKSKYRLRTVSPERLNWLKESDVTWLYGPLKQAESHPITAASEKDSTQISKTGSFINKKPILKKRSVSEVMLQKSLSNSSLVKQAAAAVQAQQGKSSRRSPGNLGSLPSTPHSNPPSRDEGVDYFDRRRRTSSTEDETPSEGHREKHLRFDDKVEQCIAVEFKEHAFGEETEQEVEDDPPNSALSDSSSDEGLYMLGRTKRHSAKKAGPQKAKISRSNSSGQMIETLPSTTLRTDSPDITAELQQQQHHVFGKGWSKDTSSKLSPSPSQETLKPTRPSRNFLLADDDDEDPNASSWSFGASNPKSSLGRSAGTSPTTSRLAANDWNAADGYDGIDGMRRTESGMFMPYDEDEDDLVAEGLFGRLSETINTAKDIYHVLFRRY